MRTLYDNMLSVNLILTCREHNGTFPLLCVVSISACLSVCLSACLLVTIRKNEWIDLMKFMINNRRNNRYNCYQLLSEFKIFFDFWTALVSLFHAPQSRRGTSRYYFNNPTTSNFQLIWFVIKKWGVKWFVVAKDSNISHYLKFSIYSSTIILAII